MLSSEQVGCPRDRLVPDASLSLRSIRFEPAIIVPDMAWPFRWRDPPVCERTGVQAEPVCATAPARHEGDGLGTAQFGSCHNARLHGAAPGRGQRGLRQALVSHASAISTGERAEAGIEQKDRSQVDRESKRGDEGE